MPGRLGRKDNFQKRFARPVGEFAPAPLLFSAQADITGYGSGKEFFYSVKCVTCQPCRTRFALLGIR